MKKMNRSQSSYRQGKTLLTEVYDDNLINKYASRNYMSKNQGVASKLMEANKQNSSLFQSISERNFASKSSKQISQFDAGQELSKRVYKQQNLTQEDLSRSRDEKEYYSKKNQGLNHSRDDNYSESYHQSEIESLREALKQRDRDIQYLKQEFHSKNDDMDSMNSMNSQISSKLQRENKEKNMYIRQINAKVIEINNLRQRVKIHKAEIDTLKLCINDKDKALKQFQQRLGQVDMKKKKVQHYEYQMKQYHQALKQLELRVQKLKDEAQNKDYIINEKTKSIFELQQTIGSYEDKLRSIQESLINISEDRKTIKDKNEELFRECSIWRESYEQQLKRNQSIQDYEIKLKTYQGLLEDANRRIMELTSQNEKIKITAISNEKSLEKYKEMQKQMTALKKDAKDKQQRIQELQVKEKAYRLLQQSCLKLKKQKEEILTKFQEKVKECKHFSLLFQQQKNRASCLEEELRQIDQNNTRIKQRGEKMQILMKENNRLTSNLHQKINEIEKLQIKINNLEIKYNQKSNQILKMKSIIQQNQQEIHQIKLEVQDLRERYQIQTNNRIINQDKVLRCNQEIYVLKCNVSKLQAQNKQALEQLEQLHSQHQKVINNFREMTSEMMQDKQQSEHLLEQSRGQIQKLQIQVQNFKSQVAESQNTQKARKLQILNFQQRYNQLCHQNKILKQDKQQIIGKCQQLQDIYEFVMKFKPN